VSGIPRFQTTLALPKHEEKALQQESNSKKRRETHQFACTYNRYVFSATFYEEI
jgi:hypothetical protein